MRISWFKACLLLCLFHYNALQAQQGVDLSAVYKKESLLNQCFFLTTDTTVEAKQVAYAWFQNNSRFKPLDRFNLGYQNKTFWVVVPVKNPRPTDTYLLEIDNPHLDRVQLFRFSQNECLAVGRETGDDLPFATRSVNHRNFAWILEPDSASESFLLIHATKLNSSFSLPIYITPINTFLAEDNKSNIFYGLAFGMMLVIATYALLVGIFLKKRVYFSYFFFIICSILLLATAEGLSFQYLYPKWGKMNSVFRVAIAGLSSISFLVFSKQLLDLEKHRPVIEKVLNTIILFFSVLLVTTPFFYQVYIDFSFVIVPVVLSLAISGTGLLLWCAASTIKVQREISLFFLTAYLLVALSSTVTVMEDYGWIEKLPFNILFVGALMEILVFASAITFLIKSVYEQRNAMSVRIRKHQTELLQSYASGMEREKQRVSRELHDDIGSRLTLLKRMVTQTDSNSLKVSEQVDALSQDVRMLSHQLAPPSFADNHLQSLIESLVRDVRQTASISASVENYDFPLTLPEETKTQLFRVVQEAVQNVIKHARARSLVIQLFNHPQKLVIAIEDDGNGFDTTQSKNGLGISNMKARVASLGGVLDVSSSNTGTVVLIEVPAH
jgi:signal transduction histidine kinase